MKRVALVTVLAVISITVSARAEWQWQNPWPQGSTLDAVAFMNADTGWALGEFGTVVRTTDGGESWTLGEVPISSGATTTVTPSGTAWIAGGGVFRSTDAGASWEELTEIPRGTGYHGMVSFADDSFGWVSVWDTGLMRTTDGGNHWNMQLTPSWFYENKLLFVDRLHGFASGYDSRDLYATTDGGESWVHRPDHPSYSEVAFADSVNGWYGGQMEIYRTTDGGVIWHEQFRDSMLAGYPASVTCRNADTCFVAREGWIMRTTDGGVNWSRVLNVPSSMTNARGVRLHRMAFGDDLHGWAVGEKGRMFRTTDAGASWDSVSRGCFDDLYRISFPDSLNGWAVGDYGAAMRTTNGGTTWQRVSGLPDTYWRAVHFMTPQKGLIGTENGTIFCTTNGGQSWEDRTPDSTSGGVHGFAFFDSLHGWTTGYNLNYTSDGGLTWTARGASGETVSAVSPTEAWADNAHTTDAGLTWDYRFQALQPYDLVFSDRMHGWMARGTSWDVESIWRTSDAGATWHRCLSVSSGSNYGGIYAYGADYAWVQLSGYRGDDYNFCALRTTDGGASWDTVGIGAPAKDIFIYDPQHIWAVGDGPYIRRYIPDAPTAVHPVAAPLPDKIALSVFPNPFNPRTTLSFDLPKAGMVRLRVYDVQGRLVRTLVDKVLPAGNHTMEWDGSGLSSGIYFARLESGKAFATQKLVLLR